MPSERPSALLQRLLRVAPLMRRALGVAIALGMSAVVAIVVQAAALADALGAVFYHHHVNVTGDALWFLAATMVRALAVGMSETVTARVAAPARRQLRSRLLARVVRRGSTQSVDATVQLATAGIDAIESYVANYVPSLVLATMAPVVFVAFLAWRDPLSGVVVLVSVGLLPVFMVLLGLQAKEKMEERWREQQRLAGYFGDVVRGMGVLKAHRRARRDVDALGRVGRELQRTTMSTLRVAFLSSFALELLSSLATALVALLLGIRLMDGSLELSTALAALLVTPEVFLPLRRSAAQYHASADGIAAAGALLDLVASEPSRGSLRRPCRAPTIVLEIAGVRDERRSDRSDVGATIPAGKLTVVRGPSGSGKTTLLRAVMGVCDLNDGTIYVDGTELTQLDLEEWQSTIAYLPQDPRLPGTTVRDALAMGEDDIPDHAMIEVLTALDLPLDLDRELGEGASAVSAGQRRRLALARCVLRRPQLMVLDEPTAHLDEDAERLVHALIASLPMTRLVATHHDFAADCVVTLSNVTAQRG